MRVSGHGRDETSARSLRALPDGSSDKKWPEALEIQRRLLRPAHRLHDRRQRIEILPEQADDEVVVVLVEAVAREADVVGIVADAERHADCAMLGEDDALLLGGQLGELAAPAQWIPDCPAPSWIEHRPPRTGEQHLLEVGFVADRVGAAERRVLGFLRERSKGPAIQ